MFDSGVGGLSILQSVAALLPGEAVCYFADTAHCPYGNRPSAEIAGLCHSIVHFLLEQNCKLIIVACNTATAMAIDSLRRDFPHTPFVGIEPATKPAAAKSRAGIIGVLATAGTFQGRLFNETRAHLDGKVRVLTAEGTGLVELVEAGHGDSPEAEALLRQHLGPMLAEGIDRLVLGCTHFPFLRGAIRRIVGETLQLEIPGEAVARRTRQLLKERGLLASRQPGHPCHHFFASGNTSTLAAMTGQAVTKILFAPSLLPVVL
jgi:glutamate racemase